MIRRVRMTPSPLHREANIDALVSGAADIWWRSSSYLSAAA
jgi:hypothetical protein